MTFDCHNNGIRGTGNEQAEVMIVGVAPARQEMRTGIPYSGETGRLLRACLAAVESPFDNCYATNLLCWWKTDPDMDDAMACAPRLVREIVSIKPKVIVAVGALPSQFFTGHKKASEIRGSCVWNEQFNCWVIPTWQPTVVLQVNPSYISDIIRDLAKINYIKDKPHDFGNVQYEVIHSPVHAQQILDSDWIRTSDFVSLDVETKWDREKKVWINDIRCLSISDGYITYTLPEAVLESGLRWPTNDVCWTYHNGMFDTRILLEDLRVDLPIVEDTMLMSYSLDERGGSDDESEVDLAVGIHGLKRLSREYCGAGFYSVDLKTAPDEVVWQYNAMDAAYTARLARLFKEWQLKDVGRTREVYKELTLPQAQVSRDEYIHGVYVDRPKLNAIAITWLEEWTQLNKELEDDAKAYGWPEPSFNFNSPVQMKRFLNVYLHLNVPNAQKGTLEQYAGHPWIAKYQRAKRLDKQLGTYVLGTAKVIHPDGRVRPAASLHGTMSGRLTYHKPPIGTVPTGAQYVDPDEEPDEETKAQIKEFSQIRALYGAPVHDDKVFIEADYSAAELWTAAYYSDDDTMLADLLSGDFHSNASETMFKVKRSDFSPEHWKGMRRESKYVTFGVLYNRGARSLYSPAPGQGGNLGKKYSLEQIEEMVKLWHERYHKHAAWAAREVAMAHENGYQINIAGRVRRYHAPGVYGHHFANMVVNFPIQSTAHDHLIKSRIDLDRMFREGTFPARSLWDGHDAIYFECPSSAAEDACRMIKQVMESPRWFERGIPVDIKVGPNWADAKEWKAA